MSRTFALAAASGLDSKQDRNAMHIQVTQGSPARERRLQMIAANIHSFPISSGTFMNPNHRSDDSAPKNPDDKRPTTPGSRQDLSQHRPTRRERTLWRKAQNEIDALVKKRRDRRTGRRPPHH